MAQKTVKQTELGRRNARIAFRFVLVLSIIVGALALYSRCQKSVADISLWHQMQSGQTGIDEAHDPLALCRDSGPFSLIAVSSDHRTIGYSCDYGTGQAANLMINKMLEAGWRPVSLMASTLHDQGLDGLAIADGDLSRQAEVGLSMSDECYEGMIDDGTEQRSISTIVEPIAILFEKEGRDGEAQSQLLVQYFPVAQGTSIVVSVL